MTHKILIPLLFFFVPSIALASIRVTEIMYDLPGADSGREWVEVINDGSSAIDLKDYKFFNKEGGHLLKAYGTGSTEIPAGGVVIIADKPDLFLTDNAGFSGLLIDSSFSLTSADTVGVKDPDGAIIESVAYTSDQGAKGDGNSLQVNGTTIVAALPTPGTAARSSALATSASTQTTPASSTSATQTTGTTTPSVTSSGSTAPLKRITVDAGGDRIVTIGADVVYSAKVYGTAGELISNPRLVWNFGNGESREGKTVSFAYEYPGNYNLMVTGASGEYSSSDRVQITTVPANVALITETDGSLSLLNKEKRDLDVSLWRLSRGSVTFLIPANTVVSGNGRIPFSSQTTHLPSVGEAVLLYPNGVSAMRGASSTVATSTGQQATTTATTTSNLVASSTPIAEVVAHGMERISNTFSGTSNEASAASAVEATAKDESLQNKKNRNKVSWMIWLAGALSLGVLGAMATVFLRKVPSTSLKTAVNEADTYEIVE